MDTTQTLLQPQPQSVRSITEMIGDSLSLSSKEIQNDQEKMQETLKYNATRMMPENSTLMTRRFPVPVMPMVLHLDSDLIARQLQESRKSSIAVDYEWPDNLGEAMTLASRGMLGVLWDNPEEDEAWRDL